MKGQFSKKLLLFTWLIDFVIGICIIANLHFHLHQICINLHLCIIVVKNQLSHNNGRILILEVSINDERFILLNLYNANMEIEQVKTINDLSYLLTKLRGKNCFTQFSTRTY